jgi:hypothetical protein
MQSKKPRWNQNDSKSVSTGALFWVDKTGDIRQVQPCANCKKPVLVPWVSRSLPSVKCGNCSQKS